MKTYSSFLMLVVLSSCDALKPEKSASLSSPESTVERVLPREIPPSGLKPLTLRIQSNLMDLKTEVKEKPVALEKGVWKNNTIYTLPDSVTNESTDFSTGLEITSDPIVFLSTPSVSVLIPSERLPDGKTLRITGLSRKIANGSATLEFRNVFLSQDREGVPIQIQVRIMPHEITFNQGTFQGISEDFFSRTESGKLYRLIQVIRVKNSESSPVSLQTPLQEIAGNLSQGIYRQENVNSECSADISTRRELEIFSEHFLLRPLNLNFLSNGVLEVNPGEVGLIGIYANEQKALQFAELGTPPVEGTDVDFVDHCESTCMRGTDTACTLWDKKVIHGMRHLTHLREPVTLDLSHDFRLWTRFTDLPAEEETSVVSLPLPGLGVMAPKGLYEK